MFVANMAGSKIAFIPDSMFGQVSLLVALNYIGSAAVRHQNFVRRSPE
jgi:hypothetical protein